MPWFARAAGSWPTSSSSHSLNADSLRAHTAVYRTVMYGPSELTRSERELMAVAVSAANGCHY